MQAKEAAPLADDPLTEKRLLAITAELRCLVCQNQTIADSNADLANDFRREIRKPIAEGKSTRKSWTSWSHARRLRPLPSAGEGYDNPALAGPGVLLVIGLAVLIRYLRRRNDAIADTELTADELQQANALLGDTNDKKPQ